MINCCICFESEKKENGILCSKKHFICDEDANQYVKTLFESDQLQKYKGC